MRSLVGCSPNGLMRRCSPLSTGSRPRSADVRLSALFEHGLSGHLWPIHLHPQADELLSSWLTRLRLAYGLAPRAFWPSLSSIPRRGARDIDRRAPAALLALLAQRTATSLPRVFATTLTAYERHLRELCTPTNAPHWLFVNALQSQHHGLPALQYCPQCLRRDAQPYFRRRWRLSLVTLCLIHHCHLLDRCPGGHVPIFPVRLPAEQGVKSPYVSTCSTDPLCSTTATGVWPLRSRDTKRDSALSSAD